MDTVASERGTPEDTHRTQSNPNNQRTERREPGRRQLVKWPKANEVAVWQKLDKDLSLILEHSLRGQVESKLNRIGDILYEECRGRFGVTADKRKSGPMQKGRRQREIEQLVKRRRQLRKQWRKASREEKEGLKSLWEELKINLAFGGQNVFANAEGGRRRRGATSSKIPSSMRDSFSRTREVGSWRLLNLSWRVTSRSSTVTQRGQLHWDPLDMFLAQLPQLFCLMLPSPNSVR